MPDYERDMVTFDAEKMDSTDEAILFLIEGQEVWCPRRICEWEPKTPDGVVGEVTMTVQFATEKELA